MKDKHKLLSILLTVCMIVRLVPCTLMPVRAASPATGANASNRHDDVRNATLAWGADDAVATVDGTAYESLDAAPETVLGESEADAKTVTLVADTLISNQTIIPKDRSGASVDTSVVTVNAKGDVRAVCAVTVTKSDSPDNPGNPDDPDSPVAATGVTLNSAALPLTVDGTFAPDAADAMRRAVGPGLINGVDGRLAPQSGATRAQVAAIMMRFISNINK